MLLAREKKIVTLLIEHEDKLTTTQIATSLKVSSRTIKADIKKINEELEKHSCRINSQQGVGLWIEYDNHEAKKYLKEVTRDTADLYLSPEVRKYHLAVELLLQDDYTSMEVLAKEYYISKATVLNDLNELDELWEHYGVHFIKKVKYGIKVEGNESQIRSALLEALKRAGGRQKVTVSNIQSHFTSVELKDLREIIGQMEGRFGIAISTVLPWSRNKFTKTEKEQALSLVILSCCYVQEGVIPFQLKDPVRLTASICVGGAITGGLCMMFGLESPAVHGGVFSVAMTSNPLLFIGLWLLGGCITGLLYSILKRPLAEGAEDEEMENPLI